MAFYELRQYKVWPGKMDEWVNFMEKEIIPFQISKGMVITGSFRGEKDDTTYIWLRRFEDEKVEKNSIKMFTKVITGKTQLLNIYQTYWIATV